MKKEEKWKEKKDWRERPGSFGERRSRLVEAGLWRREEVDGGRQLGEEQLEVWESQGSERKSNEEKLRDRKLNEEKLNERKPKEKELSERKSNEERLRERKLNEEKLIERKPKEKELNERKSNEEKLNKKKLTEGRWNERNSNEAELDRRKLNKEKLSEDNGNEGEVNKEMDEENRIMDVRQVEIARRWGVARSGRDCGTEPEMVGVATVEADELFGRSTGYPTSRRPIDSRRELTTEPWEVVSEWFASSGITVGSSAKRRMESSDPELAQATARLFYTWKDLFVEDLVAMPATDLVTHSIPTWSDAIPVRARDKLYTPRERKWMDRVIPNMLQSGVIDHSISPWCHRTKFVPKKDGDLRMVHVYIPINAATIPNSYPMKRIEPILNSLMLPGLKVYFQADAANGYWAVPLVPGHAYKTAFGTHMGQFHYLRMGQGLSGAPQTYTRLKDIFSGPIP